MLVKCECGVVDEVRELDHCACGLPHGAGEVTKTIYVAASFPEKYAAMRVVNIFVKHGWKSNTNWLRHKNGSEEEAAQDYYDVMRSDCVCVITGDNLSKGGRHTECGIALGAGIACVRIGPMEQIFHHLIPEIDAEEYARIYAKRYE